MKIDISITDATPEEAAKLFSALSGGTVPAPKGPTLDDHAHIAEYQADALAKTDPKEETPPQSTETEEASGVSAEHTTPALDVPSGDEFPKPNAHGVMVDGLGLPWDDRINTSSKKCVKNKPYNWKVTPKTDPALVETVRRELMQVMSAGAPTAGTAGGSSTVTTVAPSPAATSAPAVTAEPLTPPTPPAEPAPPTPPPAPPAPPAAPEGAPASEAVTTFPQLIVAVNGNPAWTEEAIKAVLAPFNIEHIGLLASRPDLVPQVAKAFGL